MNAYRRSSGRYFARQGRVYGPYEETEIRDLQASGKLDEFRWIWDEPEQQWKPMDPAPRLAPGTVSADAVEAGELLEAVAHNGHDFLSGELNALTETGCELVSWHEEPVPLFGEGSPVKLNLLQVGSGRLVNAVASVCAVKRGQGGAWVYRLRWAERPRFEAA